MSFDVKNTGERAGAEVAQVYLGLPKGTDEPPRRIVGWDKVELSPGETRRVTVLVDPEMMSIFNVQKHGWELAPGEYTVYVGGSSRDLPLNQALQIPAQP